MCPPLCTQLLLQDCFGVRYFLLHIAAWGNPRCSQLWSSLEDPRGLTALYDGCSRDNLSPSLPTRTRPCRAFDFRSAMLTHNNKTLSPTGTAIKKGTHKWPHRNITKSENPNPLAVWALRPQGYSSPLPLSLPPLPSALSSPPSNLTISGAD